MKVNSLSVSRRGVALVITLVLLSVITFMAIAFLVLSRGEKSSVTTTTEQMMAKLAADTGVERAKASVMAPIITWGNEYRYDLMVSTNYIRRGGYNPATAANRLNYDNVSYAYANGTPVTGNDFLSVLTNLLYSPRVPVFVSTNRAFAPDFRYYLDLNRNRRYDTNGYLPAMSGDPAAAYYDTNGVKTTTTLAGNTWTNFYVGDPEWIGVLERPGFPHSSSNRFVSRYAYIVVPEGKTLDLNAIHNYAKGISPQTMSGSDGDGFLRNQGVGPWEINLAAFLVDLNTNLWPFPANNNTGSRYFYGSSGIDLQRGNTGVAFEDSLFLLRYRYGVNMEQNLLPVQTLFGPRGAAAFQTDFVDGYTGGPLMTNNWWPTGSNDRDASKVRRRPWSGAESPNRFFTTQELFDDTRILSGTPRPQVTFSDRLRFAGTNDNSYERYTFYRMLAQLGNDSAPEPPGRMNLNYDNLTKYDTKGIADTSGRASVTNYVPWDSTGITFFTNAASRLLASAGFTFGITNIQIYPTNYYTPSVHRLLQLAANMFDATTNRIYGSSTNEPGLPSVFRPVFGRGVYGGDDISIVGYEPVRDALIVTAPPPMLDVFKAEDRQVINSWDNNSMVYGVPLVVGAKKGLPNFNEFASQTIMQVTRKLEFIPDTDGKVVRTNQMYEMGISNVFGLEAWNSYSNPFPHGLQLFARAEVFAYMTNNQTGQTLVNQVHRQGYTNFIAANTWTGYRDLSREQYSFQVPLDPKTNIQAFLPYSTWINAQQIFVPLTGIFEQSAGFPTPQLSLKLRTRVWFALRDMAANRIIDYVMLDGVENAVDVASLLSAGGECGANFVVSAKPGSMWCTNTVPAGNPMVPHFGMRNQIAAGIGQVLLSEDQWKQSTPYLPGGNLRSAAQNSFRNKLINPAYAKGGGRFYAPYNPVRTVYLNTSWQANDPLVHYTIGDLVVMLTTNKYEWDHTINPPIANIRHVNGRYEPWTEQLAAGSTSPTRFMLELKDPLVTRSDDWDFPTNKFPNVGWLGRVHRGTPWQTVYLKSEHVGAGMWKQWTGNPFQPVNYGQLPTNVFALNKLYDDSVLTLPARDRELFDQFTTSFSESASRGQLSINQTNLAAWSAVLSGVLVLSNTVTDAQLSNDPFLRPTNTWFPVQPVGTYDWTKNSTNWPAVARIVKGINENRANLTNFNRGVFSRLGDILITPELTVASPFLNTSSAVQRQRAVSDAAYERIPQQVLGLLRVDPEPRFVIYSYGQSLKPADRSVVTSGRFLGVCTNYQVTAEVATRAVVRVQNPTTQPKVVIEKYNVLPPD